MQAESGVGVSELAEGEFRAEVIGRDGERGDEFLAGLVLRPESGLAEAGDVVRQRNARAGRLATATGFARAEAGLPADSGGEDRAVCGSTPRQLADCGSGRRPRKAAAPLVLKQENVDG